VKRLLPLIIFISASIDVSAEPKLPIRSGQYRFQHHYAEQPNLQSIPLVAKISGHHIVLINQVQSEVFPKGIIAQGTLMWHAKSKQWIIGEDKSDRYINDIGGCSDGPEVVDLERKIYWTC
jgi:hypothetical protein